MLSNVKNALTPLKLNENYILNFEDTMDKLYDPNSASERGTLYPLRN